MRRKQVLALLLAVAMTANMSMPAFAAASAPVHGSIFWGSEETDTITEKDLAQALAAAVGTGQETEGAEKEETVYVFTDASGNQKSMTVSSWLKNTKGADKLYDNSILQNIENVKGDESFTQSGDILTWNAGGNDIYYQGTTEKAAPVTQKITYYLDEKEIAPADLAGKSGKVRIHIDYLNSEKYDEVFVPFTTMTGIIFSNDNVKNVEVDNGSVLSEGKNTVVVGMAFPGLGDSLKGAKEDAEHLLEETEASQKSKDKLDELDIPDSVDITMDATDFKMSTCMTMVFSGLLDDDEDIDEDHDSFLKDMDEKIADLEKDGNDLADGAGELSDGINEAADGSDDLADGAGELADGIKEYTDGVSQVNDGASQISDGTQTLVDGLPTLTKGLKDYTDGVAQADSGAGQLKDGISQYTGGVTELNKGAGQLKEGAGQLTDSLPELTGGLKQYTDGVSQVNDGADQLVQGFPGLTGGAEALSDGLGQLGVGIDGLTIGLIELYDGTSEQGGLHQLSESSGDLVDGAGDLATGAQQLSEGLAQYTAGVAGAKNGTASMIGEDGMISKLESSAGSLADDISDYNSAVSNSVTKVEESAGKISKGASEAKKAVGDLNGKISNIDIENVEETVNMAADSIADPIGQINKNAKSLGEIANMDDFAASQNTIDTAKEAGLKTAGNISYEESDVSLDVYQAVYDSLSNLPEDERENAAQAAQAAANEKVRELNDQLDT